MPCETPRPETITALRVGGVLAELVAYRLARNYPRARTCDCKVLDFILKKKKKI